MVPPPGFTTLCAGYESSEWRCDQLADHLLEWLPEFALRHSERESLGAHNAIAMARQAARSVYTSPRYKKRGEIGELLLHVALRQVFGSIPAVTKYFFKDAANDTVKGFDAAHVVLSGKSLELWLGEVKFYDKVDRAIRDVVAELDAHTKRNYMRAECAFLTNKIDSAWPHADRLKKLLDRNRSLDEIFDAVCVPVLLTYNSPCVAGHNKLTIAFKAALQAEVEAHYQTFAAKKLPGNVTIHLILVPLKAKQALAAAFDERLKRWQ